MADPRNPSPEAPCSDRIAGYCTNVHPGATLDQLCRQLDLHAVRVRRRLCDAGPLPIGLWLSAQAASQFIADGEFQRFRRWLDERSLAVFTINGFPYHDFHEEVVKRRVYEPNWADRERERYTLDLMALLASLTSRSDEGSISTLPIGWKAAMDDRSVITAARRIRRVADALAETALRTGRRMHLDLEPEPGCQLQTSRDVVRFFEQRLLRPHHDAAPNLEHVRICHDICHAAVMFEDQADMLRRYDAAGIKVGKVQVSNAIRVDFDALSPPERPEALRQLRAFEEDRYLHQTCIRDNATGAITFHEDLPLATRAAEERGEAIGEWRIHFHVPIYLESFGLLGTTRHCIDECLELMKPRHEVRHFEVETYAWNVLPPELRKEDLAEGIADELTWLRARMADGRP